MTQPTNNAQNISDGASIGRIALRLPTFWRGNVPLWIKQCDSAFVLSQITQDETKYAALVSTLDSETLSHVSDIILNPPATDKYKILSDRLINEFTDSEHQKIKKLLTELQLGDDKPSQLLRKMKELSGGQLQDEFLKNLWLQRLPTQIQTVLSVSSEHLDKLAEIADKVADVALPAMVYGATVMAPVAPAPSEIQELTKQIADLHVQIAHLSRSRNRSDFPHRPSSRSNSRRWRPNICYYHRRFRDNAHKCVQPCEYMQPQSRNGHNSDNQEN